MGIDGILRTFVPEADLLRDRKAGLVSDEEYTELYCEMLETIPKCFIEKLIEDGESRNIALCCYCGKDSFCHRHILAEWLNKNYNLNIKEFENEVCKTNS